MDGAGSDSRLRVVIHDALGPTTKADCLNRLYAALCADEARGGFAYAGIILHDAEDMVHPAALAEMDRALGEVEFVQLPVRPEPQRASPWVAGHYTDEFTEAHAKSLVVRDMLGAVDRSHAIRLIEALAEHDGAALLAQADALRGLGLSATGTLAEVADLLQQMAVAQAVPDD